MEYKFLDSSIDLSSISLPNSDEINTYLLKNNSSEITKALEFLGNKNSLLYVHGFLGTGKRQFINYISKFIDKDVIKLEYYCKLSTVCDDILLDFIDNIESNYIKNPVVNVKITTLAVKFQQYIATSGKPFLVVLHSYDDIPDEHRKLISDVLEKAGKSSNVKIIISTRAIIPKIVGELNIDTNIALKPFSREIFEEFVKSNKILSDSDTIDSFYKTTRGYYYYTALSIKIIQAKKITLNNFLDEYAKSQTSFDNYLGTAYVSLIPQTIRNFFWFLKTIRHGISLNTLAVYELYDEFSIEYLKTNLMIFQVEEKLFVQDYFQQNIKVDIPPKVAIKLHKFIISIYEKELKEPLKNRSLVMSRQAFRIEIDYHNHCILDIESGSQEKNESPDIRASVSDIKTNELKDIDTSLEAKLNTAKKLVENKQITQAIEIYTNIINNETVNTRTLADLRLELARLYKQIKDFRKALHYYELVEKYYISDKENINLNYLYYEMTELFQATYKKERAIDTIKKVIYSVDTPQSLMVQACTILGNIYSDSDEPDDAYKYYKKALESIDENASKDTLIELYFKYALACDEHNMLNEALDYYNKCISFPDSSPYKSPAYSNLGSCYFENNNYSDASYCFQKSYDLEKAANNYDGIYYSALNLAKLYKIVMPSKALPYLLEAKQSADFLNEDYYILEASIELGDYYYNQSNKYNEALKEYKCALESARRVGDSVDLSKIEKRINDMEIRIANRKE